MKKLTLKLNILTLSAILSVMFFVAFTIPAQKVFADYSYYDSGFNDYYGSGFDYYDSGFNDYYGSNYYDSGLGYYDPGYYNYGYFDSGLGSYYDYSPYYNYDYGSYYDNTCYDCGYTQPCYDCVPAQPCYDCVPAQPVNEIAISCYPNRSDANTDESVTWLATAVGGNGSFSYSWSGTDGLSGSGRQISKTYDSSGSKSAHVTVSSGGKTASANCGTVLIREQEEYLSGSCSVDDSSVDVGDSVRWRADASGGNGSYSYEWSGDYPLSGRSGSGVSVTYDSPGTKYGSVTIRSGNKSITRSCGNVYVNDDNHYYYNDLNISCNVNSANIALGQTAVWNTHVSGGNGNYYYSWSGTDGIYGNSSSVSKVFNTAGQKTPTVTVTSNGRTKSLTCPSVFVGSLAYPNLGTPASLSSVYLNQVPYTGIGDNPKLMAFIVGLLMFSAFGAYMIVARKAKIDRKNKILEFKNQNMMNRIKN